MRLSILYLSTFVLGAQKPGKTLHKHERTTEEMVLQIFGRGYQKMIQDFSNSNSLDVSATIQAIGLQKTSISSSKDLQGAIIKEVSKVSGHLVQPESTEGNSGDLLAAHYNAFENELVKGPISFAESFAYVAHPTILGPYGHGHISRGDNDVAIMGLLQKARDVLQEVSKNIGEASGTLQLSKAISTVGAPLNDLIKYYNHEMSKYVDFRGFKLKETIPNEDLPLYFDDVKLILSKCEFPAKRMQHGHYQDISPLFLLYGGLGRYQDIWTNGHLEMGDMFQMLKELRNQLITGIKVYTVNDVEGFNSTRKSTCVFELNENPVALVEKFDQFALGWTLKTPGPRTPYGPATNELERELANALEHMNYFTASDFHAGDFDLIRRILCETPIEMGPRSTVNGLLSTVLVGCEMEQAKIEKVNALVAPVFVAPQNVSASDLFAPVDTLLTDNLEIVKRALSPQNVSSGVLGAVADIGKGNGQIVANNFPNIQRVVSSNGTVSWDDANAKCQSMGLQLPVPTTIADIESLAGHLDSIRYVCKPHLTFGRPASERGACQSHKSLATIMWVGLRKNENGEMVNYSGHYAGQVSNILNYQNTDHQDCGGIYSFQTGGVFDYYCDETTPQQKAIFCV